MKITVVSGKGETQRKEEIEIAEGATVGDLAKLYRPKMSIHQKAFKIPSSAPPPPPKEGAKPRENMITLDFRKTLAEQGVTAGTVVTFKNLGPQIGYRTVFYIEYAGPLAFILLYYLRPSFIYGSQVANYSQAQKTLVGLFAAHFVKRELETAFVHKFSRPTMPLFNIFKNCSYYWTFAACIGWVLCHPSYTAPSETQVMTGSVAMILCELLNFAVHMQLSLMRKGDGDQSRKEPTGPLFALLSCPNYFFEVLSWVSFSYASNIAASWVFTLAGFLQMAQWALKKHSGYKKQNPKTHKKAIIPFIL